MLVISRFRLAVACTIGMSLFSGCGDGNGPTDMARDDGSAPVAVQSAAPGQGILLAGRGPGGPGGPGPGSAGPRGPGDPDWPSFLSERLKGEQDRIAARRLSGKRETDSLTIEWRAFLKTRRDRRASTLLMCEPKPYEAETAIIGPEGGEIAFGPHKIKIPKGALSEPTVVTAEALSSLIVSAEFSPHGVVFARKVELELSYKGCVLPTDFRKLLAVYLDDDDNILEYPVALDFRRGDKVIARIDHFSKYAVAY
jgi:hypothetical protein